MWSTRGRWAAEQFEWKLACCGGVRRRGERAFTHFSAIVLTKINYYIVQDGILNCISMLNQHFNTRAVVCDNHSTNVSAYEDLKNLYPWSIRDNAMTIYFWKIYILIFDNPSYRKHSKQSPRKQIFQETALEMSLMCVTIKTTPGTIQWLIFHRIHEKIQ